MNNIDVVSIIKKQNLDDRRYFNSIIEEAYNLRLLTDGDILNLQSQTLKLLDEIIYKYNGLDSSSIRKEIIEEISNSIYYTINIYLKSFINPDDAVKVIKEKGVKNAYEEGKKKIYRMLDIIRVLYIKVKKNKINIGNEVYDSTILKGIKGFLKIYNPDFKAQDMIITADYPLYNDIIGKLEGVEFIEKYLNSIYIENCFCQKFTEERIKYLLYGYSSDYRALVINIFETILLEAFACKLANRNILDLIITESDLEKIYKIFQDQNDLNSIIDKTYEKIKEELLTNDIEIQNYINKNLSYIKTLINTAFKNQTLDKVFLVQQFIY